MLALEWCHLCFSSSVFLMQFPKQEVSLANIAFIHNGIVKESVEHLLAGGSFETRT